MENNKKNILVVSLFSFFVLGIGFTSIASAEKNYVIIMPSGSSDPDAPFFWSEKSTGVTTGVITIHPNDSVTWENANTAFHTITSVTPQGEIDGLFDSGFINAGESYSRQFPDLGDYYYFCSIHPWMSGIVHVVKDPGSVKSIQSVGSGYSEDGLGFEVKYILDANLQKAVHIDPDERTLTFRVSGDTQNEQITLVLPPKLIENPNAVWIDGKMTDFESETTSTGTKLIIPIEPGTSEIRIMGTYVIPEFGFIALGILSVGLFSTLFLMRSRLSII